MTVTKALGLPRDCLAGTSRSKFLDDVLSLSPWENVIQRSPEFLLEVKMSQNTPITFATATRITISAQILDGQMQVPF